MKSEVEIYVDYGKAIYQANRLDELVRTLNNLYKNEQECIQGISRDWTGENASAYVKKANKTCDDLQKIIKQLQDSSNTLRTTAYNMMRTEQNAVAILKRSI